MISATGVRDQNAYTLVELMIVGAIVGVITLLCWPSLRGMSQRIAARSETQRALINTQIAREKAALAGTTQEWDKNDEK